MSGNRCESDFRSRGREFDPGRSHTYMEIDHEIISMVILLPSTESFKNCCCQLQAKVCAQSTGSLLIQACPRKSVDWWSDRPAMTIAVGLGLKATKQTNKTKIYNKSDITWWISALWYFQMQSAIWFTIAKSVFHMRTKWTFPVIEHIYSTSIK